MIGDVLFGPIFEAVGSAVKETFNKDVSSYAGPSTFSEIAWVLFGIGVMSLVLFVMFNTTAFLTFLLGLVR